MSIDAGNGTKPSIRFTLPQLGAFASITGLLVFITGFISGYLTFKSEMQTVNVSLTQLQSNVAVLNAGAANDRQMLSTRLTTLENETKWIKEGVGELRLSLIPKK